MKGAIIIAIAGVMAFFALIFLLLAVRDALDIAVFRWVADLITAAILLVMGVNGALIAKKKLTAPISTEMTKKSIKEDVEMAKSLGKR